MVYLILRRTEKWLMVISLADSSRNLHKDSCRTLNLNSYLSKMNLELKNRIMKLSGLDDI